VVTQTLSNDAVLVWRKSRIPSRYEPMMADQDYIDSCVAAVQPEGWLQKWTGAFREGRILRSDDYKMCGMGLYIVGESRANFIGAAAMQALILQGHVKSARYITMEDLVEAESPEGERLGDRRWVDLMLIKGVGMQRMTVADWGNSVVNSIVRRRYDKGLPTIVTSMAQPGESGMAPDVVDMFIKISLKG
jgi:hypothetical protein